MIEGNTLKILISGTVIFILLVSLSVSGRQAHSETQPTAVTKELKQNKIGQTERTRYGQNLGINLYMNFQLAGRGRTISVKDSKKNGQYRYNYYQSEDEGKSYKANGYNVKTNEKVCTGETLRVNEFSVSGEYFQKGGPTDSPPVKYVDNLDQIKSQIESRAYRTHTERIVICSWAIDDEVRRGPQRCVIDGKVLCSQSCQMEAKNNLEKLSDKEFKVTGAGKAILKVTCEPECILFVDRKEGEYIYESGRSVLQRNVHLDPVYGYMELKGYAGYGRKGVKTKELKMSKTYKLEAGEGFGPEIKVAGAYIPKDVEKGSSFIVRLEVENRGDMKANLDKMDLNLPQSEVIYGPKSIEPGEKKEVLIRTQASGGGQLKLDLDYTSEHLSCLNKKDFHQSFDLGTVSVSGAESCSTNADCPSREICCAGTCRDPTTGVCDDVDGDGIMDTWVEL